jgi:hypothetical protein
MIVMIALVFIKPPGFAFQNIKTELCFDSRQIAYFPHAHTPYGRNHGRCFNQLAGCCSAEDADLAVVFAAPG